jgi:hypothetical protein
MPVQKWLGTPTIYYGDDDIVPVYKHNAIQEQWKAWEETSTNYKHYTDENGHLHAPTILPSRMISVSTAYEAEGISLQHRHW